MIPCESLSYLLSAKAVNTFLWILATLSVTPFMIVPNAADTKGEKNPEVKIVK